MVSFPGLYFVIALDDEARFVRPDPENSLHTVGCVDLATLQQNNVDPTDPGGTSRLGHISFTPLLAERICEDLAVDLFTHLVLVAPSPVLQRLISLIDAPTAASLVGTLARDLMAVPDLELWPRLLPWIQPSEMNRVPGVPLLEW
jgi:hypothetical protein